MRRRGPLWLWGTLAVLYGVFRLWYDGGGGPLSSEEVEHYLGRFAQRGAPAERLEKLREFLTGDTGSDLLIANYIRFHDDPDARAQLDRYMEHMYPALFARACHPVVAGPVVGRALDIWGIEDGERWSMVGLVRYRSRRDMMEIASDPAFADAHEFKQAAMAQTIAIPVEPFLLVASPRWLVLGALVLVGALLQPWLARRHA